MIGDADLLAGVAGIRRPPPTARLRRIAVVATLLTAAVGGARAVGEVVWIDAPERSVAAPGVGVAPGAPVVVPSDVLAGALAAPWTLLDLGMRSDEPGAATVTARFEAPEGAPARPERLLAALTAWRSDDLVTVAVVATPTGTAVELRGSLAIDRSPRPGESVEAGLLPLRIAEHVELAGAEPVGVRIVPAEGGREAVALTLVGDADGAVAAVGALENGPSAPARISSMRARRADGTVTVDLILTPRLGVGSTTTSGARTAAPTGQRP